VYYWMGKLGIVPGQVITQQDITFRQRILEKPVVVRNANTTTTRAPIALLELAFELVRLREFPAMPSRFECLFLWDNEGWAREYHNDAGYAGLYIVEIADEEQVFKGDFALITNFNLPDTIEKMMGRARRYWNGEIQGKYEELLIGNIRVVSQIA